MAMADADNAASIGHSLDREICFLLVHGILHVLGMDHATPEETVVMQAREREHLDRFSQDEQP